MKIRRFMHSKILLVLTLMQTDRLCSRKGSFQMISQHNQKVPLSGIPQTIAETTTTILFSFFLLLVGCTVFGNGAIKSEAHSDKQIPP
jgi:hypothetical protein